ELLEDYHRRLYAPEDTELRLAIERIIRIFKSSLFQALLDIQECYQVQVSDSKAANNSEADDTVSGHLNGRAAHNTGPAADQRQQQQQQSINSKAARALLA